LHFLSWILVGAVAGWLAGKILKGNDYGPTMGMGIDGSIAGGTLDAIGWLGWVQQGNYNNWLAQGFSQ